MQTQPSESRTYTDPRTGAWVRQVTDHPSIHHHPFYYLPCMDDAMMRLFFVSHRTGRPEIWCELRATGELQQITNHPDRCADNRHAHNRPGPLVQQRNGRQRGEHGGQADEHRATPQTDLVDHEEQSKQAEASQDAAPREGERLWTCKLHAPAQAGTTTTPRPSR